jgi:hypothetical protein
MLISKRRAAGCPGSKLIHVILSSNMGNVTVQETVQNTGYEKIHTSWKNFLIILISLAIVHMSSY